MNYARFGRRLFAGIIDAFILSVPSLVLLWAGSFSQPIAILCTLINGFLYWAYVFYFHGSSGQTPGKSVLGIRVVHLDGSPIGWTTSLRRSSIDLIFAVVSTSLLIMAILTLSAADFSPGDSMSLVHKIMGARPRIGYWLDKAANIWIWSEVITMLFNQKKRAIHDLIAGTVVILEAKNEPAPLPPTESNS